jgi:tetratricopeptide (TPR) repeat protein
MRTALLVDLFQQLPAIPDGDFFSDRAVGLQTHLERFRSGVTDKYSEGTLQRLLEANAVQIRRAALLALGLVGTMESNPAVAARLLDGETQVRRLAADALWNIWFRAEGELNRRELQRVAHLKDLRKCLRGLNAIIERLPMFAEAYNQRAILYFRLGEFQKAVADCEKVLQLNPYHFGAQAGMAHCYVKMRKSRAALRAFRHALRINPDLDEVADSIRTLEEKLGEGGAK